MSSTTFSEILFFPNIASWSGSLVPGFGDCQDGAYSLGTALHCPKARRKVPTLAGDHHQLIPGTEGKHTGAVRRARSRVTVVVHIALSSELDQTGAGRGDRVAVVGRILGRLLEDVCASDKLRCGEESSELHPVEARFLDHHFGRILLGVGCHVVAVCLVRFSLCAGGEGDLLVAGGEYNSWE